MPKTVIDYIPGSELPAGWLEKAHEPETQVFEVTLRPTKKLPPKEKQAKNRWEKLIERIERERPLEGQSDELIKVSRQFRDCFTLKELDPLKEND